MNSSVMQSMVKEPSTVVSSIRNTTKHTETCHGVTEEIRIEKRSPLLNLENKKRDKQELKQESQFSLFKTNLLIRVEKNFLGFQATFLQFLDWHVQTHFAATWKQPWQLHEQCNLSKRGKNQRNFNGVPDYSFKPGNSTSAVTTIDPKRISTLSFCKNFPRGVTTESSKLSVTPATMWPCLQEQNWETNEQNNKQIKHELEQLFVGSWNLRMRRRINCKSQSYAWTRERRNKSCVILGSDLLYYSSF